jgi:hypothetical protein
MILVDERRVRQLPAWRLRVARATAGSAAIVVLAGWALTTGASYRLVSHFVRMRPVTAVTTTRPEVGVLVDAPPGEVEAVASALSRRGIHASFAVAGGASASAMAPAVYGDQVLPELPNGGLVRWMGARGELHRLAHELGYGHPSLYVSHGPSLGQWLVVHGAGGRMVSGAVILDSDHDDSLHALRAGDVIEVSTWGSEQVDAVIGRLIKALRTDHLSAVPVGRLMQDAQTPA